MLKLSKLDKDTGKLLFAIDNRSDFFRNVEKSKTACVNVYFPLSKEKLKFHGEIITLDSKSQEFDDDQSSGKISTNIREAIWSGLGSEEKKSYKSVKPDATQGANDELNTFNNPEVAQIAENFAVLVVQPFKGSYLRQQCVISLAEHTLYTMPQVVADKRAPEFESLFKPYKKNKKYIHTRNQDGSWTVKAVNSW